MKELIKKVYYCDHCKKHGLSKPKMEHHEKICFKNPENNRPCFDCINLEKIDTLVYAGYGDMNGNEVERKVSIFYCNKKEHFVYPPTISIKKNSFETDKLNIEMPKECELLNEKKEYNWIKDIW